MPSQSLERLICVKDCEVLEQKNCDKANDALGLTSKEGGTAVVLQLKNSNRVSDSHVLYLYEGPQAGTNLNKRCRRNAGTADAGPVHGGAHLAENHWCDGISRNFSLILL